jgi:hypothetical protein
MHILHDPDEWETVTTSRPCTACDGGRRRCNGMCNGAFSFSNRRRPPEEVAKIKAEKQRQHEDAILAEAEAIRRRRGTSPR